MSSVLIGWELGAGLGHVMRAAAFARTFASAGVRVVVAMPDLADSPRVRWPSDVRIVPAPQARRLPAGFADQSTYGELLYGCGYHDANQVAGLIAGWFNLMDLAQADVVFADHAPAAHLAARVMGIAHVRIGTGFFAPPPVSLSPRFRNWHSTDPARALTVEQHVLGVLNDSMRACGAAPAGNLAAALAPDLDLIASWPELDCYAHLRPASSAVYIGNESVGDDGMAARWPGPGLPGRKRVIAYLKADYGAAAQVLAALRGQCETVAYVSGLGNADCERLSGDTLWVAPEPIKLIEAARQCDAFVCHGGAGSAPIFLAAGKPVLMLPYSAEQRVNAAQIAATGAALWMAEEAVGASFASELARLLDDPTFTDAARSLAALWRERRGAGTVEEGVAQTLALLQGGHGAADASGG